MTDPKAQMTTAPSGLADPSRILVAQAGHTPLSDQSIDEILACHAALGSTMEPFLSMGWRPAGVEANKVDYPLSPDSLRRFAAYYFLSIGFESFQATT